MEGIVRPLVEKLVGCYGQGHVGALDGDADIVKVKLVQEMYVAHSTLHQGLRGDAAVLGPQALFQGAAVDTHPDGDGFPAADIRHRFYPIHAADVAGVDADGVYPPLRAHEGQFVVEVDIRHQGDGDLLFQLVHR